MRRFPIHPDDRRRFPDAPSSVPWQLVAPHARQAQRNHSQSLEALAQRSGLTWCELVAVLEDRPWHGMKPEAALSKGLALLRQYEGGNP